MLESLFNKVVIMLSYDLCGTFKITYFLITPQNQTTFLRKQISKATQRRQSHMCSLVHWYFTKFFSELSYQNPKFVFWTNCAFPLNCPLEKCSLPGKLTLGQLPPLKKLFYQIFVAFYIILLTFYSNQFQRRIQEPCNIYNRSPCESS